MDGSGDLGRLETNQWGQLQDMASRFEAAWKDADTVDLTAFLPAAGHPLRRVALHELIKTDMEARWRRGQIIGVEAYVEKFPELGNVSVLSPALIYEEYRVRHQHGDKPPLGGYERRFPRQFPELQRLVREQPLPTIAPTPNEPTAEMKSFGKEQVLRIGGGYRMIKRIGCGGFAEVWQAETPGGFPVAIKRILRPLDHAEAQLELRALGEIKQLSHPYLLQTRDYDLLDNRLYVVMDLADCTLFDRLQQCKAAGEQGIPIDELLPYIHEAAEAIDYMHGEKVHHRDIKPKNILLHKGHAKVADFGLARMVASQRLTVTGSGTAPYMAPEVWRRQTSPHSDQYSLAVSYAELRLGRLPFAGTDMYSLMMDHIEGRPNLDPLPEAEQQVLRKAMAKDPAERYPNCTALVQALEQALETVPASRPAPSSSRRRKSTAHQPVLRRADDMGTMVPSDTPTEPPPTQVSSDLQPPAGTPGWKGTRGPRLPRGPSWVFIGACFALLLALTVWKLWPPNLGGFEVTPLEPITLKAGQSAKVSVRVQRSSFDGPILLESIAGPDGVTLSGSVKPGEDSAEVTVSADADADPGDAELTIRAKAEGRQPRETTLPLTIEPAYWKPNWHRAPDAKMIEDVRHRRHWSHVRVDYHGVPVRFVLIPQVKDDSGDGSLPTFYIMENKVWNQLYGHFADRQPVMAGVTWEDGVYGLGKKKPLELGKTDGQLPAFNMTVEQAHYLASELGGRLPTARQWDKASGYYKKVRGKGPFRVPAGRAETPEGCKWQPGEIAIDRAVKGPMDVGQATCDESPYGCRDMAGNGCEWTRDLPGAINRPFPLKNPGEDDTVVLRGKRFAARDPWLFSTVDSSEILGMEAGNYLKPQPHIGFRIVIEIE